MSNDPHGQTGQPLPKAVDGPSSHDLLVEDILERKAFGLKKYGQPLRAHNGRDTLRDAYEEVIDLAVYLRTLMTERETIESAVKAERLACISALRVLQQPYKRSSHQYSALDTAIMALEQRE